MQTNHANEEGLYFSTRLFFAVPIQTQFNFSKELTIMSDNFDAILDATLDDLADLPEFVTPPAGAYNVTILEALVKKINEKPAVEFKLRFDSTVELNDANDAPIKDGTECNVAYILDNEFGQGNLKELLKQLADLAGEGTIREKITNLKGAQVLMITSVRKDKKDADKKYLQIKTATPL